eukprot:scaffold17712_cov111-Isochrysis_galbana.AAC.4
MLVSHHQLVPPPQHRRPLLASPAAPPRQSCLGRGNGDHRLGTPHVGTDAEQLARRRIAH